LLNFLNISEAKFNFTVALSGNADILGIFGKLGKLLGIGRIGVNLAGSFSHFI
jgi:hypothetical protein